jgi:hypothetical protein
MTRTEQALSIWELHKELHSRIKLNDVQVRSKAKVPVCGDFAEPSDGLEPSTPSLPSKVCLLRGVATGCRSALLSRFLGGCACEGLPPVAPAWLHRCSIPSRTSTAAWPLPTTTALYWSMSCTSCGFFTSTSTPRSARPAPAGGDLARGAAPARCCHSNGHLVSLLSS